VAYEYIHSNFGWIAHSIKKLETTGLSLQESMDILEIAEMKCSVVRGTIGEKISGKFQAVLKRNPGYSTFFVICRIIDGEDTDPPEDISPGKFHLLKFAPLTSCDMKKSLSAHRRILSDRRFSLKITKYLSVKIKFTLYQLTIYNNISYPSIVQ
jgi:hypothetical protein